MLRAGYFLPELYTNGRRFVAHIVNITTGAIFPTINTVKQTAEQHSSAQPIRLAKSYLDLCINQCDWLNTAEFILAYT
jgi:hypothetical protein